MGRIGITLDGGMTTKYKRGIPVLIGELVKEPPPGSWGQCRVWCPWCRRYHFHGTDYAGNFEGHRVAHCSSGPFEDTGYYVVSSKTAARMRPARSDRPLSEHL